VRAVLKLSLEGRAVGEVFNVGGKDEISILNLAKLIIELTNSKSNIIFQSYKELSKKGYEDISRRVPEISKIKNYVGWEPTLDLHSVIDDILKSKIKET
jgi:UDP-glucose 4-epimerase